MNFSITNTRSKIILALAVSTIIAFFFVGQQYFLSYSFDKKFDFIEDLGYQLIYYYTWASLFFIIIPVANRYRVERDLWKKNLLIHLIFGLIFAFSHRITAWFLYLIIFVPDKMHLVLSAKMLNGAFDSFVTYWFILGAYYGLDYYSQYREHKIKAAELESQLAHAQIRALKMQLHPHFLFNTMHAISTLMEEDVKTARRMIAKLSSLLRLTLDNIGVEEVPLNQEIEFLKSYLEIEQTRFQDRLKINYKIVPQTLNASVPNLILQPLVENAVKHGIAPYAEGGIIEIASQAIESRLLLKVSDNGKGNTNGSFKEGVGLKTTKERLHQHYGNNFSMEINTDEGNGFEVIISIPFKEYKENNIGSENNE